MTQFVGRHVSPEILALVLLELLLSFALAYIFFMPATGGLVLEAKAVNHALVLAGTIALTAFAIGVYRPQIFARVPTLVFNTILGGLLAFPAIWIVSKAMGLSQYWPVGYDALRPIKIVAIWIGALLTIRLLFLVAVRLDLFVHRVAIATGVETPGTAAALRSAREGFLEVELIRPEHASPEALSLARIRTLVFAAAPSPSVPAGVIDAFVSRGIRVETETEFWERHLRRINLGRLSQSWFDALDLTPERPLAKAAARLADIVFSILLLLAVLPLMLVMALLIRLDSRGPVLYQQERAGLHGKPFTLLKFRSMRVNAEALGPTWAEKRDPRVTRIGSFMRKTRVDELPQLLNILKGEMSFIGPRPERPHFVEQLAEAIPFYSERARVKPGLTGWAQVNYPYGASVEDARAKLSYDLYYVKNRGLPLDVLILFSTIRVILFQEGAR